MRDFLLYVFEYLSNATTIALGSVQLEIKQASHQQTGCLPAAMGLNRYQCLIDLIRGQAFTRLIVGRQPQ